MRIIPKLKPNKTYRAIIQARHLATMQLVVLRTPAHIAALPVGDIGAASLPRLEGGEGREYRLNQ